MQKSILRKLLKVINLGHYYFGVVYLNGIGVMRNANFVVEYFLMAANDDQSKAFYQLAKIF